MKKLLFLSLLVLLISGCKAKTGQNWDQSVGEATYDDIVRQLGPPERETTLSDGARVGDWFLRRGPTTSTFQSFPNTLMTMGHLHEFPDSLLRFSFDKDGVMREWKRVYR